MKKQTHQDKVLKALKRKPYLTSSELMVEIGTNYIIILNTLAELKRAGLVEPFSLPRRRPVYWRLTEKDQISKMEEQ